MDRVTAREPSAATIALVDPNAICSNGWDRGRFSQPASGLAEAAVRDRPRFAGQGDLCVRWLYLAIVVLFVAALIIFVFQNTQSVGVSFLALGVTLPLAALVLVVYVLGALSGGSLYALLRRSVAGSRRV
jgi:uncharacterized integral membrane protein